MRAGTGPQGTVYNLGNTGGQRTQTLTAVNIVSHTHSMYVATAAAAPANASAPSVKVFTPSANLNAMGSDLPPPNAFGQLSMMPPYLALNYCIVVLGTYPPNPAG